MTTNPTIDITTWSDEVLAQLEAQRSLLQRLAKLSEQQASMIRDGRTDALLGLLSQRQQVIDTFVVSQNDLSPLVNDLDLRLQRVPAPTCDRIRSLIGTIREQLAAVVQRDATDQQSLQAARDETRDRLGGLGTVRQARNAYRQSPGTTTRFADRRG